MYTINKNCGRKEGRRIDRHRYFRLSGGAVASFPLARYFFNYLEDRSPAGYRYAFNGTILIALRGNERKRNYADRSTLAQLAAALIISCFINQTSSRRDRNFRDYEEERGPTMTPPPCPTYPTSFPPYVFINSKQGDKFIEIFTTLHLFVFSNPIVYPICARKREGKKKEDE